MKLIGKLLGIALILVAFYSPDFKDWKGCAVFAILILSGASNLTDDTDAEFFRKLTYVFRKTAFVIAIAVIAKYIFNF